jgi:phytoene synthase
MQHSRAITKKSASNLALAFMLLPRPKRDAMSALYAFCREVDDVADEESTPAAQRLARLKEWGEDIRRACEGRSPRMAVNQELQPFIHRFRLPLEHFDAILQGVEMDLSIKRYPTYQELDLYCYRVASAVGLLSIEIFGYTQPACREYAVQLGKALQFTNILRDVGTDAARGRIYLPLAELEAFQVCPDEILRRESSDRFVRLAESFAARARDFYRVAAASLPVADRRSMVAAELMGSVYWRLLERIERSGFDVLGAAPAQVPKAEKIRLTFRAWRRHWWGSLAPNYGMRAA